jgi:hypothetical protein
MGSVYIKKQIILILLVLTLVLSVCGIVSAVDNPGEITNDDIYAYWEYDIGAGACELYLENVGSETRNQFEWTVSDLLTLTAPGGWSYVYDSNTDLVTLNGNPNELDTGTYITIPFTFNPTNKELAYGNLDYDGHITSGTLENIGVVISSIPDADDDGIADDIDNCPDDANPDQNDTDDDGIGDVCDDCTDVDEDTYCLEVDDCNDDNDAIHPGADEVCNGIDDNCDTTPDTGGDALCDDSLFCNGEETCEGVSGCQAGIAPVIDDSVGCTDDSCDEINDIIVNTVNDGNCDNTLFCDGTETCDAILDCQTGTVVDCSGNDLATIETCDNDPDNNPFTWDYFAGFTSTCDEGADSCTTGTVDLTNTCDISECSAICETDADCDDSIPNTVDTCFLCSCVHSVINVDNDEDGYTDDVDCDDDNASIHPGADEVCNGVDDNCDGSIDENFICLSQDPIAYYPFDSDYNDYSGNGFDGVPNGDVYIDTEEGINGAAVFDGNGDFIDISRALNTKSFTISGWVQSDSLTNYESIFDIGNEDNHIGITKDRPGSFFQWGSISKTEPIDNQWNYITWIYDEIGNHWKVYVDGERFAHISGTWGGLDAPVGTGSQYWGVFYKGTFSKYFGGKLDEMTIHNRVLSEQEILDLCISGGRPGCFNTVEITQGWNLLSIPIIPTTNDADRTISLKTGWNMFGHLSQNPFLWSDAKVSDGTTTKSISEAEAAGWLQETIYYFDEGEQVYKFIPGDEDSLTVNKGYWLYAVKDNLELIFPSVGGALEDNAYNWLDAEVIKGTETKTIEEAQAAGWLQGTIYYFDENSQTYKFVPGDDDNVYPDRGYWLYSKEDLSLVIS